MTRPIIPAAASNSKGWPLCGVPGLGSDETAAGLMQSLEDVFEEDGITAIIKKRLIAFVADGASVNLGKVDQI